MSDHLIYKPTTSIDEKISELRTVVFIDYEAFFWSLYNNYGEKPDLNSFVSDVKKRGKIEKIKVFGDFSKPEIQLELDKIRTITSDITNCNNPNKDSTKEYTDFIMLDHLYQAHFSQPEIQQYILVTGDGHFSSIATFLRTYKDKIVGIYGVKGSVSAHLVNCASWGIEMQPIGGGQNYYSIQLLQTIMASEQKNYWPFFGKTVDYVSKGNPVEKPKYIASLKKLIQDGYIAQEERELEDERRLKVLVPNWDLIKRHGLMTEPAGTLRSAI